MNVNLRPVSSETRDEACGAKDQLFQLQVEQFDHDEKHHREIARLDTHHRLSHLALHFAKYAGQLIEVGDDEEKIRKLTTDIFIIALSCSNILNVRMYEKLQPANHSTSENLIDLGWEIHESVPEPVASTESLIQSTTIFAGRIAAACEKLDHIEDYPFRRTIEDSVVNLAKGVLMYASANRWDLMMLVRDRLQCVKEKFFLHSHV